MIPLNPHHAANTHKMPNTTVIDGNPSSNSTTRQEKHSYKREEGSEIPWSVLLHATHKFPKHFQHFLCTFTNTRRLPSNAAAGAMVLPCHSDIFAISYFCRFIFLLVLEKWPNRSWSGNDSFALRVHFGQPRKIRCQDFSCDSLRIPPFFVKYILWGIEEILVVVTFIEFVNQTRAIVWKLTVNWQLFRFANNWKYALVRKWKYFEAFYDFVKKQSDGMALITICKCWKLRSHWPLLSMNNAVKYLLG